MTASALTHYFVLLRLRRPPDRCTPPCTYCMKQLKKQPEAQLHKTVPTFLHLLFACLMCSWGTSWGISGTVRVAYGSAYIMQDDYTFALSFGPNTVAAIEADIVARLQQGLSSDATTPGCMLYKTLDNTRLISLLNDAITLSNLLGSALASSDILADVVSSNLGYMPVLSAASRGPFRVCGATGAWLSTYVDATAHASPSPSAISPSPAPSPSPRGEVKLNTNVALCGTLLGDVPGPPCT